MHYIKLWSRDSSTSFDQSSVQDDQKMKFSVSVSLTKEKRSRHIVRLLIEYGAKSSSRDKL